MPTSDGEVVVAAANRTDRSAMTLGCAASLVGAVAWTKKLTTSLHKMGSNRTTNLASLKRHLSSAVDTLPEAGGEHSLLANLTAAGVVSVSDANVVTYHLPTT